MSKVGKTDPIITARVKKTAELTGLSPDYIYKVLRCDRQSERVMEVYMELQEKEEEVFKNLMHQQVNKMVPIQTIKRKTDQKQGESNRKRTEKTENV